VLMSKTPRRALLASALALAVAAAISAAPSAKKPPAKKKETKMKVRDYAKTHAVLHTSQGDVTIRLFYDKAPNHVKNFVDLAASGFYDGTLFHRVIPGFMVQGGDPLTKDPMKSRFFGTGGNTDKGGAPVNVKAEFNETSHKRGIVSMARASDPDSASSQFFIVVKDSPFLDRQYTAFGEVASGMDVVDKLVTESNPDTSDPRSGGLPRSFQKIVRVELAEDAGK
jgi:peptidyl-prolyl cis-trans isomerase B (cyclophilin B)